jgi:hypothetical protein
MVRRHMGSGASALQPEPTHWEQDAIDLARLVHEMADALDGAVVSGGYHLVEAGDPPSPRPQPGPRTRPPGRLGARAGGPRTPSQ